MANSSKSRLTLLSVLAILSFSTFAATFAYAAPQATTAKDWQFPDGNSWAWNYSPETSINKNTAGNLEVKWIFPLEGKAAAGSSMAYIQSQNGGEGSTTPPIVVGGNVFVTTNYMRTYSINAQTGKLNWKYDYSVNLTDVQKRLPVTLSTPPHMHGFRYWAAGNALVINGLDCGIYGIDATTGKKSFAVTDLCKDIPGNLYNYYRNAGYSAVTSQASVGIWDKGNQFIVVLPGGMHSTIYAGDARHVTLGVDITTKQIKWRVFSYPPQDAPTKDWALQECNIGFFKGTIPCSEVAAKAPGNLEWDWAQPNEKPNIYGGVTANWGQSIVDEDTGILYTQTGNQGPYTYVGTTPGPRLYGSTIMAIDMSQGKRIWWSQPFPRDPYDYDCNWSGILADIPTLGKVYMKGCKEGRLNVMDAKTGKSVWMKDVTEDMVKIGSITQAALKEPNQGGIRYHWTDVYSTYDMREMKSPDNSNYCGRPCPVFPAWSNGIFGTDMTYNPDSNTLFHYAIGLQTQILNSPAPVVGQSVSQTKGFPVLNATIMARDASTGNIKWTYFYGDQQRASMLTTPDLLITGFSDGHLRVFDQGTGKILNDVNVGSDMHVGITTGQDSTGNQLIFTILGSGPGQTAIRPVTSGTVVAIGLSKATAQTQVSTVTTTQTTTQSTTVTSTSASISTVTTTAQAQTTTVTSSAPAQTTTVVSSVTQTSGLPSEVTYAAIAVAVIAVIAAAVLVMRKK
ncbi:MAG: PQQ-binding-like beta-propeller repeat protein [Thaumarchaeota archaeon]|nr:PQQ-binding-like beta-propeller repeat protein [Nitrososphaerota archaeon]MCL5317396.1 PQQ-binding-like beta-propeller repeat protein [Nitrososphaerota archaeon]